MRFDLQDWASSFYVFENGDGTKYTVHVTEAQYGGLYVICNESSLWRWHGEGDIKFLCGNNNEYTRRAMITIMAYHDSKFIDESHPQEGD
tara:strand:+ start:1734 stop:2003 length:270 start_codon:yes stop_codon:yes gene_type:complete